MKITKSQLKQIIKEEIERLPNGVPLNENLAALAQVMKYLPQIIELVKILPEIKELMGSLKGAEGAAPGTPDVTPPTATPDVTPAT
jgi:hypothetical protein